MPVPRVSVFLSRAGRARAADPGRRAGAGRRVPAGHVPLRRPGQGQRGQRAQRAAAGDRRTAPGSASCRSPGCWPGGSSATSRPGDEVAAGETYGLIRFGSRVDTYLPAGSRVTVAVGQRTIGGETVLAELPAERRAVMALPAYPAGVRLLPNAVTVLALCSGLSAVYFALERPVRAVRRRGRRRRAVRRARRPAGPAARRHHPDRRRAGLAVRPGLLRRRAGAGALHLAAGGQPLRLDRRAGLRGVHGAAAGPVQHADRRRGRVPVHQGVLRRRAGPGRGAGWPACRCTCTLHFGPGWWSSPLLVGLWALLVAGLMVSRLPTLSFKTRAGAARSSSRRCWCWSGWRPRC